MKTVNLCLVCSLALAVGLVPLSMPAQRLPNKTNPIHNVVEGSLIVAGSTPFHLRAVITEGQEQSPYGQIEMFWMAPDKFRRVIKSDDFSQTLIVNGNQTFEQNSSDYFPLQLHTLITAMMDPQAIIDAIQPGDLVLIKSNGAVNESGIKCVDRNNNFCVKDKNGLRETIAASGHAVDWSQYEMFDGKRIARVITNAPRLGEDLLTLTIEELRPIQPLDESLFEIPNPTDPQHQIRFIDLSEEDLRRNLLGSSEIIWPQTLDSTEKGPASFYVSIDPTGSVREVLQLYTVNERANDSAIDQIMKWKYKPITKGGFPAQAEGVLSFTLDTRAWGPASPLTDAEARKLASNITAPDVPVGKFPVGTVCNLRISVDSTGKVIEAIIDGCPSGLGIPSLDALRKWQFSPIMENGQPRPYRANIEFRIP
jgi:Gram-negative bacterial TonB protein C-terminal